MFEFCRGTHEGFIRVRQSWIDTCSTAGFDGTDAIDDVAFVGCRMQFADPITLAIKSDNPELVFGAEQLGRALGGVLGHFHFVAPHRTRFVDHQNHRQARLFFFLVEIASDRQDLLERRFVVAT